MALLIRLMKDSNSCSSWLMSIRLVSAIAACDASDSASRWSEGERSEEHTSELQSRLHLVCRLLLEKKKTLYAKRCSPGLQETSRPARADPRAGAAETGPSHPASLLHPHI